MIDDIISELMIKTTINTLNDNEQLQPMCCLIDDDNEITCLPLPPIINQNSKEMTVDLLKLMTREMNIKGIIIQLESFVVKLKNNETIFCSPIEHPNKKDSIIYIYEYIKNDGKIHNNVSIYIINKNDGKVSLEECTDSSEISNVSELFTGILTERNVNNIKLNEVSKKSNIIKGNFGS